MRAGEATQVAHSLLDRMHTTTRAELAADVERLGSRLVGLTMPQVADLLGEAGRKPSGTPSSRAMRLHAWVIRHGLASPNSPRSAEDSPRSVPRAQPTTPPDLEVTPRWDRPTASTSEIRRETIEEERPIEDLLVEVEERYRRHAVQAEAAARPQRVHVPAGPYAIAHVGDPHLDDDGCDWPALRRMVRVVASTPSMYAGNVGDNVNNWVGRLAEQYEHQHITGDEGWRLAEWLFSAVPWVYCLWGNHDLWRRGGTILRLLAERAGVGGPIGAHEIRLEVVSPGVSEPHRVHVRHDFKGSSIWNPVHGNVRASKLDPWADVYVCGHRHEWGTHVEEGPDGRVRWAIRARGYKRHDDYARRLGFSEQTHGETVCTVIDPSHRHPYERVRVHLDVEEAAEHLRWLRRRAGLERA